MMHMPKPEWMEIDGLRIRLVRSSGESETSILLLSPWPESLYAYEPIWNGLTTLGQVTAIDLPGMGMSEGRPDLMGAERMADFVLDAIEVLDLGVPHGIGPDVGTSTFLYAAAKRPNAFRSLIVGGGATNHETVSGGLYELVHSPAEEIFPKIVSDDFLRSAVSTLEQYAIPEEILNDYLQSYRGERFRNSAEFLRDYPSALPRLNSLLPRVTTPVLILAGERDMFVPVVNAESLQRALPGSEMHLLDAGHFAWEDQAEEYLRLSSTWIAQHNDTKPA